MSIATARRSEPDASVSKPSPRWLIWAIVAISAGLGAVAPAHPTGNATGDALWCGATGAVLALAGADSRRWSWFPLAGVAVAVARGVAVLAGLGSLVLTFAAGFGAPRRRWMGALTGGLAAQALLRGATYGPTGLPTLVAVLAASPVIVSGLANTSTRRRRRLRAAALVTGVVMALLTVFTMVSAVHARDRVLRAVDFGDQAVAAAEKGDQQLAAVLIDASGDELAAIETDFGHPWLAPARLVPVLGQHAAALSDVAGAGARVARAAATVIDLLDPEQIAAAGRVDVAAVDRLGAPMRRLRVALDTAEAQVAQVDRTWLLTPAEDRVELLADELAGRAADVRVADELTQIAPALLGADGDRRYLVVFLTPAEARGSGGFAGNWAEIVASGGSLDVVAAGRGDDLNDGLGQAVAPIDPQLVAAYAGFPLDDFFGNLPVSPDFPTTARAAATFYRAATGRAVDGVIGVDPAGLAGVLALTGPVTIDARTLDSTTVEDFLLREQYVAYEDDNDGRVRMLDELTTQAFDRLTADAPASPWRLAQVLAPLARDDRLRLLLLDPDEAEALAGTDIADAFPVAVGQDLLAVTVQNLGQNKIDSYLEQTIDYVADADPRTGTVVSTLSVTLTNTAPSAGLPGAIIASNDQGLPPGTNRLLLGVYTPLDVTAASLDGTPSFVAASGELGWNRYTMEVLIGPGDTVVVQLSLAGSLPVSGDYVLDVALQPLANPPTVRAELRLPGDWFAQMGLDPATDGAKLRLEHDGRVVASQLRDQG